MTIEHSEAARCVGTVVSAKKATLRDENGDRVLNDRNRPVYERDETFGFILPKNAGYKKVFFHIRHVVGGIMPAIGSEVSYTLIRDPNPNKCDLAIEVMIMSKPAKAQQHAASSRQW